MINLIGFFYAPDVGANSLLVYFSIIQLIVSLKVNYKFPAIIIQQEIMKGSKKWIRLIM